MSRVLVTGATGFIGGHLVDALVERGDDVACLVRESSRTDRLDRLDARQVPCEFSDEQALSKLLDKIDVVYHVAGLMAALSDEERDRVNIQGTRAIARASAAQKTPPTLLYVSSLAAAGPSPNGHPVCESDPCRPVSHYGRSKRAGELAVTELAGRMPVTIVRPPAVFGERDVNSKSMFKVIKTFRTNFIPGWRHRRRYSFVHVGDLVAAIILAAENGHRIDPADAESDGFRQGCYYAADDDCLTYGQFGRLIGDALGRRRVLKLGSPDTLMKAIGWMYDAKAHLQKKPHSLSSDKVREINAGSWTCLPRLAHDELGFHAAMSLADRVKQTVEWMESERWL